MVQPGRGLNVKSALYYLINDITDNLLTGICKMRFYIFTCPNNFCQLPASIYSIEKFHISVRIFAPCQWHDAKISSVKTESLLDSGSDFALIPWAHPQDYTGSSNVIPLFSYIRKTYSSANKWSTIKIKISEFYLENNNPVNLLIWLVEFVNNEEDLNLLLIRIKGKK